MTACTATLPLPTPPAISVLSVTSAPVLAVCHVDPPLSSILSNVNNATLATTVQPSYSWPTAQNQDHDVEQYFQTLSTNLSEHEDQKAAMKVVLDMFGLVATQKHWPWTWESKGWKRDGFHWVPSYSFTDINGLTYKRAWEEYADGLDGHLSISKLNNLWGAKWRRGKQASENSRRNKFYSLIKALLGKPRWDRDRVFEFLNTRYPISSSSPNLNLRTTSAFMRYLAMDNSAFYEQILTDSTSFFT